MKLLKLKDPITGQKHNMIFMIINKFIKWGYFITYTKEILAEDIAQIYIKEIFVKYRALTKIILNRDTRFITVF